jgi:hypothetical protein
MMLFFIATRALGFGFALLLWLTAGRRHHEAASDSLAVDIEPTRARR